MEPVNSSDFYKDGFFGFGEKGDFQPWSLAHFLPLIFLVAAIVLIFIFRKKIAKSKWEENIRYILGFSMLIFEMSYYWRVLYVGNGTLDNTSLLTKLPLQVCEWSCIITAIMLMKKSHNLCDISFYVCLTAGLIPLFFPVVISNAGPTYYRYYQYWGEHILPIIGVFYMLFVHNYQPRFKSIYKPVVFLLLLAIPASIANYYIPGADYLYLANNTEGVSIAGYLPSNIYLKLLVLLVFVCLAFLLAFGVYKLIVYSDSRLKKARAVKTSEEVE